MKEFTGEEIGLIQVALAFYTAKSEIGIKTKKGLKPKLDNYFK